jgi:hypothetical protein
MAVTNYNKFPWTDMDIQSPADAAAITCTINSSKTKINLPTTQNYTLSLQAAQDLIKGAEVQVEIVQGGTARSVTFGSAASTIKGATNAGAINKTERYVLTWDGTQFAGNAAWASI